MITIEQVKQVDIEGLEAISAQIRARILDVVSRHGGHLSSTLGATELIVAMHKVFNCPNDPFIFDVSHQAYAHKLITGRWDAFDSLRQHGGISGYTKPSESPYDYFVAGHSSTSISLGVGAAKSIRLKKEGASRLPVVMIGDGALSAGMAYEALNELGHHKYPMVIILNDNEMSIAKPIGALSRMLSSAMASPFYQRMKHKTEQLVDHLGDSAHYLARRFEESFKLITPGILFEEMGIEYIGPVDGHDFKSIIDALELAKHMQKPVLIHAQTIKGKGYEIAEGKHEKWHGVGPFDINSGDSRKKTQKKAATKIYTETMLELCANNEKIVGVTAAMPSGTGMSELMQHYPERFYDVAIAEQHAVTSMAAMAKEGFKPFCAIYSTFLQRAYDQVIHDVCILDLPVVFALDRAGIVGEDGETHQGVFDVSYLRAIANMTLLAPCSEASMQAALSFASTFEHPCALRYPRGAFSGELTMQMPPFVLGVSHMLIENSQSDTLFIGYGNGVGRAHDVMRHGGFDVSLLDLRFVKPLDRSMLMACAQQYSRWFVFSDSVKEGGVASALLEFLSDASVDGVQVVSFEYDDQFIKHGKTDEVLTSLMLDTDSLIKRVEASLHDATIPQHAQGSSV